MYSNVNPSPRLQHGSNSVSGHPALWLHHRERTAASAGPRVGPQQTLAVSGDSFNQNTSVSWSNHCVCHIVIHPMMGILITYISTHSRNPYSWIDDDWWSSPSMRQFAKLWPRLRTCTPHPVGSTSQAPSWSTYPGQGIPQVTMGFNTKMVWDGLGYRHFRKPPL
jgi:hypothetical protein